MKQYILNPLMHYSFAFLMVMMLLSFSLSDYYKLESYELNIFVFSTILIFMLLSYFLSGIVKKKIEQSFYLIDRISTKNLVYLWFFLLALIFIDCTSVNTLPIYAIMKGSSYRYTEIGVPYLHGFLLSYSTALCFSFFVRFMKFNDKKYFYFFIFSLIVPLLLVNRNVFIFNVIGIFSIYIAYINNVKFIKKVVVYSILIMILFSVIGNLRTISDTKDANIDLDSLSIRNMAQINAEWMPEFLDWPYVYFTTPYGNLGKNYINYQEHGDAIDNVSKVIRIGVLPDFISKRVTTEDERSVYEPFLIVESFNVSTGYIQVVVIYGLIGMFILFIYLLVFNVFFILFSNNKMYVVVMAGLCASMFLMIFSYSFYSYQKVLYPIMVIFLSKVRFNNIYFL